MPEYDLVCDTCGGALQPDDGVVAWRENAQTKSEGGFALTHISCVNAEANARREARLVASPNGYLQFFGERFARAADGWSVDANGLQALLQAFAPFVMRPDSGAEMDQIRAASFGERPGVKPEPRGKQVEGGK